jgi:hypothetical protein
MRDPDLTDQVYKLMDMARRAEPPFDFSPAPVKTETVWILPHGTTGVPRYGDPKSGEPLETLFGMPVEYRDVDRPELVIRPVQAPEPGRRWIKPGIDKAMRDYDRGADLLLGDTL